MSLSNNPTSRKRFSRDGFHQIPEDQRHIMNRNNDVTIDIPLEHVPSTGSGLRTRQTLPKSVDSRTSGIDEGRPLFRGRRHRASPTTDRNANVGYDGEEDTITTMGRIYKRILNFSVVTRYFFYVLPLALLIAIPIVIGVTASKKASIGGVRIVWFFSWVEIVWLSLWVSKSVAHYLPIIFQVLVGVVNSGIRKYAMILQAVEIPLSLVGWAVASLCTFMPIMTQNPDTQAIPKPANGPDPADPQEWEKIVQNILAAALVSAIILLIEKMLVQLISINYHRKQFNARIKDSKHNIYLLGLLHEASIKLFPAYCNEFAEEDYAIADQLNIAQGFGVGGRKSAIQLSGTRTPMRLIQDVGRYGDKLTSAFGNIASEVTGKEVFNPNSSHSIVIEALERKRTSEALARRIWMSFVVEGHEALAQEDLTEVLGAGLDNEAMEAFAALDQDCNGDISLDEMILTVVEFGRERKAITNSMHDVDQAINVLDKLLMTVVFIATIFVFVAFLNSNFTTTLATTGTALLSLSFVFAATCQEFLGSCIFLFVKHPFDIGDRVDIALDQYVVEHISLLYTVFRRSTGTGVGRLVQIPNISLNTLAIENVTRSKNMTEQVKISVSFDTSFEDIQILKNEMLKFVTDKDNSRDFQPTFDVEVIGTSDMSKLELLVDIKHKSNWSNETIRSARRSKFMCALVAVLRKVPIYAPGGGNEAQGSVGNPSYSVAIDDAEAKSNVKAAADKKEAKRLVPTKNADGAEAPDAKIIEDLNARHPTVDAARDDAWELPREDSSTLGRPSNEMRDLEETRGMLRRQSTKGKRKNGADAGLAVPGISTIGERDSSPYPPSIGHMPYFGPPMTGGSLQQSYSEPQTAPFPPVQQPGAAVTQQTSGSPVSAFSQRTRTENLARKPMPPPPPPPPMSEDEERASFSNARPYSGV